MKYHYQKGITEKDKRGHKKLWVGFFGVVGVVVYGGFIFANLALNGYPLQSIDTTAKLVKKTQPGSIGDHLFIPAINLAANFSSSLVRSGEPSQSNVVVKGSQLALGFTATSLRAHSPFFNLDKLRQGDEIFLDKAKTRYVYRIGDAPDNDAKKLILQSQSKKVTAEAIGVIGWNDGKAELQPL